MDDARIYKMLEDGINRTIEKTAKKAKANYLRKIAGRPEGDYYVRTHQLEDSFDNPPYVRIVGGGEVKVKLYDPNKILSRRTKRGMFNEHMSLRGQTSYHGVPFSTYIMTWQDLGYKLPNKRKIPGLYFVRDTLDGKTFEDYMTEQVFEEIRDEFIMEIEKIINKGGGK